MTKDGGLIRLRVLLRDTETGDEGLYEYEVAPEHLESLDFLWTEGNGGCDCNRAMFLDRALGRIEREHYDETRRIR